jgi:hypothetical protein
MATENPNAQQGVKNTGEIAMSDLNVSTRFSHNNDGPIKYGVNWNDPNSSLSDLREWFGEHCWIPGVGGGGNSLVGGARAHTNMPGYGNSQEGLAPLQPRGEVKMSQFRDYTPITIRTKVSAITTSTYFNNVDGVITCRALGGEDLGTAQNNVFNIKIKGETISNVPANSGTPAQVTWGNTAGTGGTGAGQALIGDASATNSAAQTFGYRVNLDWAMPNGSTGYIQNCNVHVGFGGETDRCAYNFGGWCVAGVHFPAYPFMNKFAIWTTKAYKDATTYKTKFGAFQPTNTVTANQSEYFFDWVDFPAAGNYTVRWSVDDEGEIDFDGLGDTIQMSGFGANNWAQTHDSTITIAADEVGPQQIRVRCDNGTVVSPTAVAIGIFPAGTTPSTTDDTGYTWTTMSNQLRLPTGANFYTWGGSSTAPNDNTLSDVLKHWVTLRAE